MVRLFASLRDVQTKLSSKHSRTLRGPRPFEALERVAAARGTEIRLCLTQLGWPQVTTQHQLHWLGCVVVLSYLLASWQRLVSQW